MAGAESKEIREIDKGDKVEVGAISDKPHWGVLCPRGPNLLGSDSSPRLPLAEDRKRPRPRCRHHRTRAHKAQGSARACRQRFKRVSSVAQLSQLAAWPRVRLTRRMARPGGSPLGVLLETGHDGAKGEGDARGGAGHVQRQGVLEPSLRVPGHNQN